MLRLLMLVTLSAAVGSAADVDPVQEASAQADRADASVQSALEQAERIESTPTETLDDALRRAGALAAPDLPLLERALADPQKLASIGALLDDAQALATALHEPRAADERMAVYVFVSFSMPDVSLRALIRQGELAGVPIVLRGLVEDSVEATIERVHGLYDSKEAQAAGVLIDPTLFVRFGIDQVPAVVVAEVAAHPCTRESCPVPPHVKIAGDVPLRYALARIASARPGYRDQLRPLMTALEPGKTW